ncbi:MAG TPA: ABC transporter permease [Baekduia sp.]|nr:ABC transporter permease [Baekduia sp.]
MSQQDPPPTDATGPTAGRVSTNVDEVLGKAGIPSPRPRGSARPKRKGFSTADVVSDYGVVLFLLALIVFFSIVIPSRFPTWENTQTILGDQAIPGLLALAVVLPLAAGEFDLSIAATLGFNAVLAAYLTAHGVAVPLAFIICIACGCAIGALNALLVVGIGLNAFIATLGTATVLAGGNLFVTNGATIFEGIPKSLTKISQTEFLELPLVVFYFVVIAIGLWYLMEHTPFGRYLRATGAGREAARLTGVPTGRYLALAFIIAGALAALCGVLQTARTGSATASVGPEFLLPAYAAAFLGATTIKRGRFNVWGTVVGVFVLAVGITGLQLWGAPFWVPNVFNGTALILAVSVAVLVGRRRGDTV